MPTDKPAAAVAPPTSGRRAVFVSALRKAQDAQRDAGHLIRRYQEALTDLDAQDAAWRAHAAGSRT